MKTLLMYQKKDEKTDRELAGKIIVRIFTMI